MNALVRVAEGRVVADSRDVAAEFGKRHDNVLRAIDTMLKDQSGFALNFEVEAYPAVAGSGGTRMARRFDMDRKGFMLLVMGFSGSKALAIKSRWIDAFDAMERALLDGPVRASNDTAVPPIGEMTRKVAVCEAYRRMFGPDAGRWMVGVLGLPVPPAAMIAYEPDGMVLAADNVTAWVTECCVRDPEAKAAAGDLYASYGEWCAEGKRVPETQTGFGRALSRMGFAPYKSGAGRMVRRGLSLLI
ncbi:Rha family transcriptional regulator [Novosphingobium gossypii]|uniref:Rha family transcriptional regulator n=1 Tax=Novosphingobium gossypii TaxID=1604774 RepID=UPI003D25497B